MDKKEPQNEVTPEENNAPKFESTPRKTTTKLTINSDGEAIEAVIFNDPLVKKKSKKDAKFSNIPAKFDDNVEFFDATADFEPTPKKDMQVEIERAKQRASQEKEILERVKNAPDNSRKTYTSCVIACLVSTGILLALTIVFFLALKWYGVGIGFAIITIAATQIWISFFKRMNKKIDDEESAEIVENEQNTSSPSPKGE